MNGKDSDINITKNIGDIDDNKLDQILEEMKSMKETIEKLKDDIENKDYVLVNNDICKKYSEFSESIDRKIYTIEEETTWKNKVTAMTTSVLIAIPTIYSLGVTGTAKIVIKGISFFI